MKDSYTTDDWNRLKTLRHGFLNDVSTNYWKSHRDLELYDEVYAKRIGWKWTGVLENLENAGWKPRAKQIVDWGCGTAIASRTVASWSSIKKVALVDQSHLALSFAQEKLREQKFEATFFEKENSFEPQTLLLISHIVSELSDEELLQLAIKAATADEVIWVEPGAHAISRRLSSMREVFIQAGHQMIAPCVHQLLCPMLEDSESRFLSKIACDDVGQKVSERKNRSRINVREALSTGATKSCTTQVEFQKKSNHWCHFFASPPIEIFQSAFWHEASRQLSIDLRSLPYSYFACSRNWKPSWRTNAERMIGNPRILKAHCKLLCCGPSGLTERIVQKRNEPELFRAITKKGKRGVF